MLYWLLYQKLFPYFRPFRVFHYLTVRTAFASLTALLITLMIGPLMIEKLRWFQISQYIREDGPKDHQKKTERRRRLRSSLLIRLHRRSLPVVVPIPTSCQFDMRGQR